MRLRKIKKSRWTTCGNCGTKVRLNRKTLRARCTHCGYLVERITRNV